jgi:hypothetical protein
MKGPTEGSVLPRFFLAAESHDGPWSEVMEAWYRATGQTGICLTIDTEDADARLAVFTYQEGEVKDSVRAEDGEHDLPLVLLNARTEEVAVYGLQRRDGTRALLSRSKPVSPKSASLNGTGGYRCASVR